MSEEARLKTIELMNESTSMLVDTKEAAKLIGLAEQTMSLWRSQGRGPAFLRVGSRIRYHLDDLSNWLGQHRFRNTAQARQAQEAEKAGA
jgi:phage terminase Nu1 subunit (DNA packaging protein)